MSVIKAQSDNGAAKFTLTGKLTGRDTSFVWLRYWDKKGKEYRDTCYLKNGDFSFTGTIEEPVLVSLTGNVKGKYIDVNNPNTTDFYIEPGKTITVELTQDKFKSILVKGSVSQSQMDTLNQQKSEVNHTMESLVTNYNQLTGLYNKKDKDSLKIKEQLALVHKKIDRCSDLQKKIDYAFVSSHPDSYVSPGVLVYYVYSKQLPNDSAKLFYQNFSLRIQNSAVGQGIFKKIQEQEAATIGKTAAYFVRDDINGKKTDLSEFKDKYILLDFWASWCVPCRAFNPELKTLYQKYHSQGLEIISISSDANKDTWKNAVKKDGTSIWHQVLAYEGAAEAMGNESANNLSKKYDVTAIPVLILIDKQGLIIGRYMGQRESGTEKDLVNKLEEVFTSK
ncbi:MAG TPA: AhpC/TSA family protein [Pedobacter sp.]